MMMMIKPSLNKGLNLPFIDFESLNYLLQSLLLNLHHLILEHI